MIVLEHVSYGYSNQKMIFNDLSLSIHSGEIVAIMGPSGSGKSTLLRLISGQEQPQSGSICIDGTYISELKGSLLYAARRRMGFLFQEGALFSDLNVFDNVAFLLREHTHLPEHIIHDLVLIRLEAVGLRGAKYLPISDLSGGMARRVALARATILDPPLMLYDEPFSGQDPINRGILMQLIATWSRAMQSTALVVTHELETAEHMADRIVVVSDGVVLADAAPHDILHSEEPKLKQFVHGLPDGPIPFQYPSMDFQQELGLS